VALGGGSCSPAVADRILMTRSSRDRYWKVEAAADLEAGPVCAGDAFVSSCSSAAYSTGQAYGRCPEGGASTRQHDELTAVAAAAERGDPVAIRTLLTALTPHLLRVARRVLGPAHPDLEDVVYEAAYAVLDGLPRFRGEATMLHYACRVAAFTATNARRRDLTQKRSHRNESIDVEVCSAEGPGPEQQALSSSLIPIVRELVATLPEATAEALTLHVILGYTVQEISETCDVPVETVRSRLRLARQALRRRVLDNPILLEALEVEP
jgi:RNA polymerase sigma factor (sigma-70 family)